MGTGTDGNQNGHHKLRRLRVYGGFLDHLDLRFKDGLNCIIGGRGSGKTTVLEFIRFALDRLPSEDDPQGKVSHDKIKALLAANLGSTGCVELEVESQEGLVYHVRRTGGDPPVVTDADGKSVDAAVLRSNVLIDAAIFSHNQIEDISANPSSQRALLDRLCSHSLHEINAEVKNVTMRLKENGQQLVQLESRVEGVKQSLVDLSSWERKLKAANDALADAGIPPGLQTASEHRALREQERACLERAGDTIATLRTQLSRDLPAQIRQLATLVPGVIQEGPNGDLFGSLARTFKRRETELEILLSPVLERLGQLEDELDRNRAAVAAVHEPQEAEYTRNMAVAQAHSARLKTRDEAAREVVRLSSATRELGDLEVSLDTAKRERIKLRDAFQAARRRRFKARQDAADTVSTRLGGRVRVTITANAESREYREFLVSIMKRSGRQYNAPIDRLIKHVTPARLGELCDRRDNDALSATADVTSDFAEALIRQLRADPNRRHTLDIIDMQDEPSIELKIGDVWRASDRLSTGQKSSAILPILLMESSAPLLVDQPEDNLDNSFISDAIVPQVREIKTRRQLIMITHNPNLPVLGDAENVCVLEADGRNSRLIAGDSVHGVKQHILRLMEGGLEAFRRRQREYEG